MSLGLCIISSLKILFLSFSRLLLIYYQKEIFVWINLKFVCVNTDYFLHIGSSACAHTFMDYGKYSDAPFYIYL